MRYGWKGWIVNIVVIHDVGSTYSDEGKSLSWNTLSLHTSHESDMAGQNTDLNVSALKKRNVANRLTQMRAPKMVTHEVKYPKTARESLEATRYALPVSIRKATLH